MTKRSYRNTLIVLLIINIAAIFYFSYQALLDSIPNNIKIMVNREEKFDFSLPMQAEFSKEDIDVINVHQDELDKKQAYVNLGKPFSIASSTEGSYKMNVKLFGLFQLKQISLDVLTDIKIVPSGVPIGIYVQTDGIMVLGTGAVNGTDGLNYEPALNILQSGDYILAVNEIPIKDKGELIQQIQQNEGNELLLTIRRQAKETKVKVTPIQSRDQEYKIGVWVRDNTQGIGTLTFFTNDGEFGALGHGITDIDTGNLMEISEGAIYNTDVVQIVRGEDGSPGEMVGLIHQNKIDQYGSILINSNQGIFGKTNNQKKLTSIYGEMPIALKQDINLGKATILCHVQGEVKEYEIEIEKIERNSKNLNKGLVLRITDEELLSTTNGIIQGMSGSPILQNGKVIGAVTHVFIQDSTKGYGTFIENMLKAMKD